MNLEGFSSILEDFMNFEAFSSILDDFDGCGARFLKNWFTIFEKLVHNF